MSPGTIDRAGRTLTYAVVVTNTGGEALSDLVVTAVAQNLGALVCAPTPQGRTLGVADTTVCSGTRTSEHEDLLSGAGTFSATAAGFAPDGDAVSATAPGTLDVVTAAPNATDDFVQTVRSAPYVILPGSTNDRPVAAGGPAIDPSLTLLESPDHQWPPYRKVSDAWQVLADGSVKYRIVPAEIQGAQRGWTESIRYQSTDVTGRTSAPATLTVVVREGAFARSDQAKTTQGSSVGVEVLHNDQPGQYRGGSRAPFIEELSFGRDQPVATARSYGREVVIPRTGTFEVRGDGIGFLPEPTFVGTTSVRYTVTDRVGNVTAAIAQVTVTPVVPEVPDVSTTTTSLHQVALDLRPALRTGSAGALAVGGFASRDGSELGTSLRTAQGSWYLPVFGGSRATSVDFYPAPGFSGSATTRFTAVDRNGTEATGTLRVTVRRGWSALPDTARTTLNRDVTVDPLANDVANQHTDGTPGRFDLARLVFSGSGQPAGSTIDERGKRITLAGRGTAWISDGKVTFRPFWGYTGYVGRLALDVRDDGSSGIPQPLDTLLDRITVLVAADVPVATDDSATTVLDQPVVLPGSTNDDPGAATGPLPTSFPSTGQPDGSTVSNSGRVLVVPSQGVWSIGRSGSVTFTPDRGFVDGAAPVRYRVSGAGGSSATATLFVNVARGPLAAADVILRTWSSSVASTLDPLGNDLPGLSADGRLGGLDLTSVRFPVDGQPVGSTVSADGRVLSVLTGRPSEAFTFTAEPTTGLVGLRTAGPWRGPTPAVTYQVQDSVSDAAGDVVHRLSTSTLQAVFVGRDPVATDDQAMETGDGDATLAGALNDYPGSGSIETVIFPEDQLAGLPRGSRITHQGAGGWEIYVKGEGWWYIVTADGSALFSSENGGRATTPVRYRITDSGGGSDDGWLSVTPRPWASTVLRDDAAVTRQGMGVTVRPLDNDTLPDPADSAVFHRDRGSLELVTGIPVGATTPTDSGGKQLVVPGEGHYAVEMVADGTEVVRFLPEPAFRGTTSAVRLTRSAVTSKLQIEVTAVDPIATDDAATTKPGVPVKVAVLANDAAGTASRPLAVGSVRLQDGGLPQGAQLSADGQVLTVAGRGTFATAGDGTVTFYPLPVATGAVPRVGYQVLDVNGSTATATVAVRVA